MCEWYPISVQRHLELYIERVSRKYHFLRVKSPEKNLMLLKIFICSSILFSCPMNPFTVQFLRACITNVLATAFICALTESVRCVSGIFYRRRQLQVYNALFLSEHAFYLLSLLHAHLVCFWLLESFDIRSNLDVVVSTASQRMLFLHFWANERYFCSSLSRSVVVLAKLFLRDFCDFIVNALLQWLGIVIFKKKLLLLATRRVEMKLFHTISDRSIARFCVIRIGCVLIWRLCCLPY